MNSLLLDLRYSLRTLGRSRSFAVTSILTLAVALGANSAIFSVVNAILLRPLAYPNASRMVHVATYNSVRGARADADVSSWPNLVDLRAQSKTMDGLAAYTRSSSFLYGGDEPEHVSGVDVDRQMFDVLGVKPVVGHVFTPEEDRPDGPRVIAISYDLWMRKFGGDPKVIGRTIPFGSSGAPRLVVAVLPRSARFPIDAEAVDYWIPIQPQLGANRTERGANYLEAVGLLKRGVTTAQAQSDALLISRRLEKAYPDNDTHMAFAVDGFQDVLVAPVRPALLLLTAAVIAVLLIGCANVANLLLARAAGRHREIAIRAAIGASRARIVRQLLVESLLMSIAAGAIGLLLAAWGVDLLVAFAPPAVPRLETIALNGPVLLFTLVLSLLTGIAFGLAPALTASKTNLTETLNDATRGSTEGARSGRIRNAIVIAEIAMSLVLLVGAGLLLRSFVSLMEVDAGFDYRGTAALDLSPRSNVYKSDAEVLAFHQRVLTELAGVAGVKSVGGINNIPLGDDETVNTFSILGQPAFPRGQGPTATVLSVTPGLFPTLKIPIVQGRTFTDHDDVHSQPVAIVDETFANRFFPAHDAIGKQIRFGGDETPPRTIVGVAGAIRFESIGSDPKMTFYAPQAQRTSRYLSIVARSSNPAVLMPAMRAIVHRIDPLQPIIAARTLEGVRAQTLAGRRFSMMLLTILAVLALILSAIGIYSIMSYSVAQRTSEIGIRMALGAEAADVFRLVLKQSFRITLTGVISGAILAAMATRVMRSLLFRVSPGDPVTLAAICVLLTLVALFASYVPARRAAAVDPLVAIRYD